MSSVRSRLKGVYVNALGRLPISVRRRVIYLKAHGRMPNLRNPRKFSEKVVWRMLHDRDPELEWTCDKLAMKDRAVKHGLGIVPTIWAGDDLASLHPTILPERWVAKPNHSSGEVYFGAGSEVPDELMEIAAGWLRSPTRDSEGEWAYAFAQRVVLIEPWIGGDVDEAPIDYKVFVFAGRPRVIQVHKGRGKDHTISHFDTDWQPFEVSTDRPKCDDLERPTCLQEMLDGAARMAEGFSFMRVDFYIIDGALLLGETTPYPAGGRRRFYPRSFDDWLGDMWALGGSGEGSPRSVGTDV